jgi:putative tryptophan/tyrosine transport system substrate-binding protein
MRRRLIGLLVTLALGFLVSFVAAEAPPWGHIPRLGVLNPNPPPLSLAEAPWMARDSGILGLQQGLRELGYVEGQTIAIEARYAEGHAERLPALAAELVRLQVDVIFTASPAGVRAARQATGTVPIVAIDLETDPVASGLVASVARPGGNLTGVFLDMPELSGKWLQLLQEALARPTRVAVLGDPTINAPQFRAMEVAAQRLAVPLLPLEVHGPDEFERAFDTASTGDAGALILLSSPWVSFHGRRLAELAAQHRLPAMSLFLGFAEAGGLLAYGPSAADMARRCAVFVDKIIKGAKPSDLPIERPTTFRLVINLKTAQALGLTIPPSLLFQADEVLR